MLCASNSACANLYNDNLDFGNGVPKFEDNFGIRYSVKPNFVRRLACAGQTAQMDLALHRYRQCSRETDGNRHGSSDT